MPKAKEKQKVVKPSGEKSAIAATPSKTFDGIDYSQCGQSWK